MSDLQEGKKMQLVQKNRSVGGPSYITNIMVACIRSLAWNQTVPDEKKISLHYIQQKELKF